MNCILLDVKPFVDDLQNQSKIEILESSHLVRVSIVIPSFNSGGTLRRCLSSIMALDYPKKDLEVLIVDGGSSDETVRVAEGFPVRVLIEPKRIRGATYNRGLKEATGEYVGYIDADGGVYKSWLKEGLNLISADRSVAAVYFRSEVPEDATDFQAAAGIFQTKGKLLVQHAPALQGSGANGAIYRREALEVIRGFNEEITYGQEDELTARLQKAGYKVETGGRNLVFHYPRASVWGFFAQAVEQGIGFVRRYPILRQRRMVAYMVVRSMAAVLPLLVLIVLSRSLLAAVLLVVTIGILAMTYYANLYARLGPERRKARLVVISLPLVYISCIASLIGYTIGLAGFAWRKRRLWKTNRISIV